MSVSLTRRQMLLSAGAVGLAAVPAVAPGLFGAVREPGPVVPNVTVNVLDMMSEEQVLDIRSNRGERDVTSACRAALRAGLHVIFPAGTYLVDTDPKKCLSVVSDQRITFEPGAVLKAKSNNLELYSVLLLDGVSNVAIEGGTIQGERATHKGRTGEHGMGIAIYDSRDITLRNITCRDCWGDGIYVGGRGLTGQSTNVTIDGCVCDNNRRQGMTIAAVQGCRVTGGSYRRTNGIAPAAGIDVEPNHAQIAGIPTTKGAVTDVLIEGVDCSDNAGAGITVSQVHTSNVRIVGATAHRNGESGIICGYVGSNVDIINPDCRDNGWEGIHIVGDKAYVTKDIRIEKPRCSGNGRNGIFFGLNVDQFAVIGGTVSENGQNGILCDGTGGSVCDNGEIRGVFLHSNSRAANATFDNIRIGALCHDLLVVENNCKAGQGRNRPAYGVRVSSNEPILIARNDLTSGGVLGGGRGGGSQVRWSGNRGA